MNKQTPKTLVLAAILAFSVVALLAVPAGASAATPCWKALINDWYDGRIDKTYPRHCYREAIKHLPSDADIYSSARKDIERALQAAIVGKPAPPNGTGGSGKGGKGNVNGARNSSGGQLPEETPISKALDSFRPHNADSAPIPLLILGGLALLLMAAGGAGVVARRIQARREGPTT
jgi:hypothetical protein